jgi:hypothetical protein
VESGHSVIANSEKRVRYEEHFGGGKVAMEFWVITRFAFSNSKGGARRDLDARLLLQLALQAILQLGADLGNFHAGADHELATQKFVRLVLVGEFCDHAAVLAVLIPAETPVRNGFRADVLKTTKNRIFLRNLEFLPQDRDFDQPFVGPKNLRRPSGRSRFRRLRCRLL